MSESKSKLTVNVSVKDTELFQTMLTYTVSLIGILSEYKLSEEHERKLNEVSGKFFELEREAE